MLKKMGKAISDYSQDKSEEAQKKIETVQNIFKENVENNQAYVMGVAQTESDVKGLSATATKMLTNTIRINFVDYVTAVNLEDGTLILLQIENGAVSRKIILKKGEYSIKKESKIIDEIIGSIFPRRRDRYNRERFVVKENSSNEKYRLLVGLYVGDATNYPYNNDELLKALKALVKQPA